jgi:cell division protein FtsN
VRYRHVWPGALLLVCLVALLGMLLTWGDHFLSPGPSGGIRRLLAVWAGSAPTEAAVAREPAREPADEPPVAPERATAAEAEDAPAPEEAPRPARAEEKPRWALELGSFALSEEAERAEALLNHAGYSTVRFRQETGSRVFAVTVPLGSLEEALAAAARLREEGIEEAAAVAGPHGAAVRLGTGLPLRSAVRLSERVRAAGYTPRVAVTAGRAGQITLRHGSFGSRREAEAVGQHIAQLGLPNEVVQIR